MACQGGVGMVSVRNVYELDQAFEEDKYTHRSATSLANTLFTLASESLERQLDTEA